MKNLNLLIAVCVLVGLLQIGHFAPAVRANDVLFNGGFEIAAGPSGWNLSQTITGMPGEPVSGVEHVNFANQPESMEGQLGLYVKPFAGNVGNYEDQNLAVNVSLSQTANIGAAAANKVWTLSGHSYYQLNYSGNVDTLYTNSPSGAIASPTNTFFKVEFLNASDTVLATHTFDLPKNRTDDMLPGAWQPHVFPTPTSPATTTKVRVTAGATDMVENCGGPEGMECAGPGGQDLYLDNFLLQVTGSALNWLTNGNLNTIGAPTGWTIEKSAQDNIQFSTSNFAIHTGNQGLWLRSFSGGDAKVVQTVPATEGTSYTFSGWAKLQPGYSGLDPFSGTETFLTMEFLDNTNNVIGTPVTFDVASISWPANDPIPEGDHTGDNKVDATDYVAWRKLDSGNEQGYLDFVEDFGEETDLNQGVWQEVSVPATIAPLGAVNVRVSAGATGMVDTELPLPQSAMFDDLALIATTPGSSAGTVPEPAAFGLLSIGLFGLVAVRRRQR